MEELAEEDEVGRVFHLEVAREEPELPLADEVVVDLGARIGEFM